MNDNTKFTDLPASSFPFTIELVDAQTRTVRWSTRVTGPGALQVPSRDQINDGQPVSARITFPDGTTEEAEPE